MLRIFATLPVTTATGGKNFSALKYMKNYLRSTMSEDRLNGLAHLYINRGIELARPLQSLERVTDALGLEVAALLIVYFHLLMTFTLQ
jgi:hypothetical protein